MTQRETKQPAPNQYQRKISVPIRVSSAAIFVLAMTFFCIINISKAAAATPIYYSVGQNTDNHMTGTPTVTIASGVATFSVAQTATNMGVGDKITYNTSDVAYITGKTSTTVWTVETVTGGVPADVSSAETVNSITHAFSSLEGAVDASTSTGAFDSSHLNTKDLVTNNYQLNLPCYYDTGADTTHVSLQGWTTGVSEYIKIYTPTSTTTEVNQSQRATGKWDDTKYNLTATNSCIYNSLSNVKIFGLQMNVAGSVGGRYGVGNTLPGLTNFYIADNIIRSTNTSTGNYGIKSQSTDGGEYIWNNIVYGFGNSGYGIYAGTQSGASGDNYIYSNTVYNCSNGIVTSNRGAVAKNNIVQNCTDGYSVVSNFVSGSDHNISDIASDAPNDTWTAGDSALTVSFANVTDFDFHLSPSDTAAKNAGADLSADANLAFTTDIDGQTRNLRSDGWDIGADEAADAVYYSVGQSADNLMTGAPNVSITSGVATFNLAQTGNIGVGDDVLVGGVDYYISGKNSQTSWNVVTATGAVPTDIGSTAVTSIKRVYTSLNSAASGASTLLGTSDLYTNNYQINLPCYYDSGPDATAVTVTGYTTAYPNYIKIYTPNNTTTEANQSQRHEGKWDSSKYNISLTVTGNENAIEDDSGYIRIDGIQVSLTINSTGQINTVNGIVLSPSSASKGYVSNCIVKSSTTAGSVKYYNGIRLSSIGSTAYFYNNIVYGLIADSVSGGIYSAQGTIYAYNNTEYGCIGTSGGGHHGMNGLTEYGTYGKIIAKNNLAYGNSGGYWQIDSSSTNNLSSDDSCNFGTNCYSNQTVSFADVDNHDFHLSPNDTAAKNHGADLSADASLAFSTDIDGQTRNLRSDGWDIGADEAADAVYYSVGQNTSDHKTCTGGDCGANPLTVTVSGTTATFSVAQTATNMGVGDEITYNTSDVAYITGKIDTSNWTVETANGGVPSDITDSTVVSIAHAFSSLEGAVDAGNANGAHDSSHLNTTDLYTSNYQVNIPCYYDSGPDTATVTVTGWTTAEPDYIKIYAPNNTTTEVNQSQRHSGKWDDSKYNLSFSSANSTAINIASLTDLRIYGVQISVAANGRGINEPNVTGSAATYLDSNIIKSTGSDSMGIRYYSSAPYMYASNNILYGFVGSNGCAINNYNWSGKLYVYNNTVYGSYYGIQKGGGNLIVAKNNISYNNTFDYSTGFDSSSTNNLSSDGTAPGSNPIASATVSFVDAINDDFHLSSSDTAAKNKGADLSADPNLAFDTDIDGETRKAGAWDIGADENNNINVQINRNVNFGRNVNIK